MPHELQQLKELIEAKDGLIAHLKNRIQDAPCLVARPGEITYECRTETPCRVCQWRRDVSRELIEEWHLPEGIW
jgi:hypothetical protein